MHERDAGTKIKCRKCASKELEERVQTRAPFTVRSECAKCVYSSSKRDVRCPPLAPWPRSEAQSGLLLDASHDLSSCSFPLSRKSHSIDSNEPSRGHILRTVSVSRGRGRKRRLEPRGTKREPSRVVSRRARPTCALSFPLGLRTPTSWYSFSLPHSNVRSVGV